MEQNNSLFKNTIYKTILSIINIVVPLLIGPYVVRLLDTDLYSMYNRVLSEFQVFLAFGSFGVYTYGVREISKVRNDEKKKSKLFTNLLVISIISNLLVALIYAGYALFNAEGVTLSVYLLMMIQFVSNAFYVEFANEAAENYKFITIKSGIIKIFYFVAILLFVRKPTNILIYTLVICLTTFANNIVSFIYAAKRIKFDFSEIEFKKHLIPLISVLLISNIELLYSQLDRVMLGAYVNDIAVSTYYIGYYIVSTLAAIPYSIINVSIPRLSYLLKNEGKKVYEEKLNNSISSLLFVIVPICFGVLVLAPEVITIYCDNKYDAVIPLIIACISRLVISLESVVNNLIMYPNNKEKRIIKVSLACGILNLVLNFVLVFIGKFTPSTALITTIISEFIIFEAHYLYSKKEMDLNVEIISKRNIIYIILGLLFIPISLIIRSFNLNFYINLALIVAVCVIEYVGILYIRKDNNLDFMLSKVTKKILKKV